MEFHPYFPLTSSTGWLRIFSGIANYFTKKIPLTYSAYSHVSHDSTSVSCISACLKIQKNMKNVIFKTLEITNTCSLSTDLQPVTKINGQHLRVELPSPPISMLRLLDTCYFLLLFINTDTRRGGGRY